MAHHDRLRLHVEEADSMAGCSSAIREFLGRAEAVMTPKKYKRFEQLLRFPLESNKISKKIFSDLRRVFDGKNRVINYQFVSGSAEADFDIYRKDFLKDEEFFEEDVFEHIRTNVSDFIVIDMDQDRVLGRLAPQPYIVRCENIISTEVNPDNLCEYLVYDANVNTRVVLDDESYRVYKRTDTSEEWVLSINNKHSLGECPAKPIWSDYMHPSRNYVEKTGPISASVSDMDEVNFWDVGRRYYELYGSFPLYWEYKVDCKYQDEQGNACEGGFVTYEEYTPAFSADQGVKQEVETVRKQKACPSCTKNENLFAGTTFYVDAPKSREDADMREPMGFVTVDSAALKYNNERQERRKQEVIDFCVGINTEPMREQAINEKQVSSFFEDRKSILFRVKRNFEIIHEWTLKIIAKIRYGTQFQKVYVNYGDEFYLRSETELINNYGEARKSGLPSYLLKSNRNLLTETRFRTNHKALMRAKVLEDLEPYPDSTITELLAMQAQNPVAVNKVKFAIKLDFSNYIAKFEREESNILIFGANLPYKDKIDGINKKLYDYANEELRTNRQDADEDEQRAIRKLKAESEASAAGRESTAPKPSTGSNNGGKRR